MNLGDHLEPIAEAAGEATPALQVSDVATISIAVSLKRIADRLGQVDLAGFENQLLEIAYKASLNFGKRA